MQLHRLPWPKDELAALSDAQVELRVTLSSLWGPTQAIGSSGRSAIADRCIPIFGGGSAADAQARYALIVAIRALGSKVDIFTPVEAAIAVANAVEV
jgi:hypothetical protein